MEGKLARWIREVSYVEYLHGSPRVLLTITAPAVFLQRFVRNKFQALLGPRPYD